MRSALVLCVLAACFHDPAPAPAPAAGPPARAQRVNPAVYDPLGFLPVDSEAVVAIDVNRLRASTLWKTLEPAVSAKAGDALGRVRAQCGVDLLQSVKQIAMGFRGLGDEPAPSGVFVVRGLDRKPVWACLGHLVGADPQVTIANDVVLVKGGPGQNPAAFTFAGASTLVAVISPTASSEELARVIKGGAPLRGSPAFLEVFGRIETQRTAWFALNGNGKVFDKIAALGIRPTAFSGSVDLANGFTAAARLRLDSEDSARNLAGLGQAQLGQVKALVDEIELLSDDADLVFRVVMTQEQLESIAKMVGMFATAMGP